MDNPQKLYRSKDKNQSCQTMWNIHCHICQNNKCIYLTICSKGKHLFWISCVTIKQWIRPVRNPRPRPITVQRPTPRPRTIPRPRQISRPRPRPRSRFRNRIDPTPRPTLVLMMINYFKYHDLIHFPEFWIGRLLYHPFTPICFDQDHMSNAFQFSLVLISLSMS